MVTYWLPVSGTTSYLVYTLIIPPNFQGINMNVNIPIGAIMAGASSTGTITMSGIGATSATVLQNGNAYFSQSFSSSNATSKSFNITTSNTAYSAYSYFNTYTISFPINPSNTTTYTYTCYLNFQTPNQLSQNYPLYNCTTQTVQAYQPTNYGIVINPVSSTSTLTNCTYASGSSNTSGYYSYDYSVSGVSITPPTTYTGYACFDAVYCNKLTLSESITANGFTGLSYICVQDQTTTSNISFNTTARAVVYPTLLSYGGVFGTSSLTGGNTTITIPVSGNYEIIACGSGNYSINGAGNNVLFNLIKRTGGADTTILFQVQGTIPSTNNWLSATLVVIQPLVAGDTVRLEINTSTGTWTSNVGGRLHTMTIKRM